MGLRFLQWWRRLLARGVRPRVHNASRSHCKPCEWCEQVKSTSLNEVWSEADPAGYIVRICDDCRSSCAAG